MKIRSLHKLSASVLAISLGCALSVDAAVLLHEDWSGIDNGNTAVSGGNWVMARGLESQIAVVVNGGGYAGRFITPTAYGDVVDGLQLLPAIRSASSYTYGSEGLSLTAQVALGTGSDSSNYFRIGFRSATDPNQNYWFDLYGTYARFQKQASGTVTNLGENYKYTSATTVINNLRDVQFDLTPIDGGNRLTLTINGIEVLAFDDLTGATPSFAGGTYVTISMRSPRIGYVGEVNLSTIPEPGQLTLALGGAAFLLLVHRVRHRRRVESV